MSQKCEKPDQRRNADRASRSTKTFTRRTVSEPEQERNRVHLSIAREPHRWRRVLYRTSLPASALRVGLALADRYLNRKDGRCDPSHETLAEECDLSVRTVRDGLTALRNHGLITTRKQGLQGTLFFYFSLPANAAEIQQVDDRSQSGENSPFNVTDLRRPSDGSPASNLRGTSESEPSNAVIPRGPLSVVAKAPLSGSDSPTHITRKANVVGNGQPLDSHVEKDEEAVRCPPSLVDQIRKLHDIVGRDVDGGIIDELARTWQALGEITAVEIRRRAAIKLRRAS